MADKENAMDYPEHEKTYALFISMTKIGTAVVIAVLIILALLLL